MAFTIALYLVASSSKRRTSSRVDNLSMEDMGVVAFLHLSIPEHRRRSREYIC
jgi:hypothetical protein